MAIVKLMGFKTFKSKKGNDCYVLNLAVPYTEYQKQYGNHGSEVVSTFVDKEIYDKVTDKDLGKDVDIDTDFNKRVLALKVVQ